MFPRDILGREIKVGDWIAYPVVASSTPSMSVMHISQIEETRNSYNSNIVHAVKGNLFKKIFDWHAQKDIWICGRDTTMWSPERAVLLNTSIADPIFDITKFEAEARARTAEKKR